MAVISEKRVRESLIGQLEDKNIKTDYNLSLIDNYMTHWKALKELAADIKKRGAVCPVLNCKGNEIVKPNESIKAMQNEQATMLKIIQLLGLQEPVIKGSVSDYL